MWIMEKTKNGAKRKILSASFGCVKKVSYEKTSSPKGTGARKNKLVPFRLLLSVYRLTFIVPWIFEICQYVILNKNKRIFLCKLTINGSRADVNGRVVKMRLGEDL